MATDLLEDLLTDNKNDILENKTKNIECIHYNRLCNIFAECCNKIYSIRYIRVPYRGTVVYMVPYTRYAILIYAAGNTIIP